MRSHPADQRHRIPWRTLSRQGALQLLRLSTFSSCREYWFAKLRLILKRKTPRHTPLRTSMGGVSQTRERPVGWKCVGGRRSECALEGPVGQDQRRAALRTSMGGVSQTRGRQVEWKCVWCEGARPRVNPSKSPASLETPETPVNPGNYPKYRSGKLTR